MNFNDYQKQALTTAYTSSSYTDTLMDKTIWVMGIAGESGEVVEKWKKIVAYKDGELAGEDIQNLKKELGDIIWYIAVFAHSLGLEFDDIIQMNVDKLKDRKNRGVIKGAGDNR